MIGLTRQKNLIKEILYVRKSFYLCVETSQEYLVSHLNTSQGITKINYSWKGDFLKPSLLFTHTFILRILYEGRRGKGKLLYLSLTLGVLLFDVYLCLCFWTCCVYLCASQCLDWPPHFKLFSPSFVNILVCCAHAVDRASVHLWGLIFV